MSTIADEICERMRSHIYEEELAAAAQNYSRHTFLLTPVALAARSGSLHKALRAASDWSRMGYALPGRRFAQDTQVPNQEIT